MFDLSDVGTFVGYGSFIGNALILAFGVVLAYCMVQFGSMIVEVFWSKPESNSERLNRTRQDFTKLHK